MILYLINNDTITCMKLPSNFKGNYWLHFTDNSGNEINLINIKAQDNSYIATSNIDTTIKYNGTYMDSAILKINNFYSLKYKNKEMYLYVMPLNDQTFKGYKFNTNEINIGRISSNDISYNHPLVADVHAKIIKSGQNYTIFSVDGGIGTYVNKRRRTEKKLKTGDSIFIAGLRIIFIGDFWLINSPGKLTSIKAEEVVIEDTQENSTIKSNPYITLYNDDDYFEKSPRFITEFEPENVVIDEPPEKKQEDDTPLLFTIGPMMTMSLTSMITVWQTINNIAGGGTIYENLPSLVMALAMIMTLIMWPTLSQKYQKKKDQRKEEERQEKYKQYLERKAEEIRNLMSREKQIMIENNVPLYQCQEIIEKRSRNLWEREIYHKDFLTVRLGIGAVKPSINVSYPEDHFTMNEDNLKELLTATVQRQEFIKDVPINISLATKNISAVVGKTDLTDKFMESILLQLMTFQSYRDLKIIILKSKSDGKMSYMKTSPHLFTDDNQMRFYADNIDDIEKISNYLSHIYNTRKYDETGKPKEYDYTYYGTYYLIIADNDIKIRHTSIIKNIVKSSINVGFSLIFRSNNLTSLPKECRLFINISGDLGKSSGYFENELVSDKQQAFQAELNNEINIYDCIEKIAKIPLRIKDSSQSLPKVLSFLEMYNVGKVEQLNAEYRWKESNPTNSLGVPIGIDENGQIFKIDLHEKMHGPHGLIAGMTGSGKSELIISYILSMAVNFHPYEVSFVLIDYKGGGLTGAFENRNSGSSLPHLAGTITNLDDSTMNRSLASIHAEIERRQRVFNEAKELLGESTIDIYKYQRLYREGKVSKPISHLMIISDEFAELKQQKPEFMQELISAARIGRSLGVHLILATQKPSGIVDDQIWSNSKFKISLRVQDRQDSNEVIGRPDAAALVDVGRFYLQVGYNEFFALGQSAYTGLPYYPEEKKMKKVDTSINFINNIGNVIKSADEDVVALKAQGEEIGNIVDYLIDISNRENIHIEKLWLDELRDIIILSGLINKYGYTPIKNNINPAIGEFDDPDNQRQGIVTLPLTNGGNTIIYGMSGSGKEDLITTMIYSIIIGHDAREVNVYILDFDAETLRIFESAPQVGGVVTSNEEEKITNLFKMINSIIEKRKGILSKYSGDINLYNSKEQVPLSTIVIVINNYEAFSEMYDACNDALISISRDCFKYGIVFVLSASSPNSVRFRLSQNFKQIIPLQLNDKLDYRTLLGKSSVYPQNKTGRGLILLDDIYEFQTAIIDKKDKITDTIYNTCKQLKSTSIYSAPPIPVLPEKVTFDVLKDYIGKPKIGYYPVGINKDNLGIGSINFKNNFATLVSTYDPELLGGFANPLIKEFQHDEKVIVIDTMDIIKNDGTFSYYNTNLDEIVISLNNYINQLHNIYTANNFNLNSIDKTDNIMCVIVGLGNLINRIQSDNKAKFEEIFTKGVQLKKVIFTIIDTEGPISKYEYENWYKSSVNNTSGVWLGSGINDQSIIKLTKNSPDGKLVLPDSFGFMIDKGIAKTIKLLEGDKNGK